VLANGSLWVAIAQMSLEGAQRKCLQYGIGTFILQIVMQVLKGWGSVAELAFKVQVGMAVINLSVGLISLYYVNADSKGEYVGEKDARYTFALRVQYVYLAFMGLTYMLCPWVYSESYLKGLGPNHPHIEYWMASSGALAFGSSMVLMAAAQIDGADQKKALQYGMVRHLCSLLYFVGLAGPKLIAGDSENGLNLVYGMVAFDYFMILFLVYTAYPSSLRQMIIRSMYILGFTLAFYTFYWPSFAMVFLQYTDASKLAAFPEYSLMFFTFSLIFCAVSQFDDDAQKLVLQYLLAGLYAYVAMASQGHDFGIITYKAFFFAVVITCELYSEYAFAKFAPLFKSSSPTKMAKAPASASKAAAKNRSRSKTPVMKK